MWVVPQIACAVVLVLCAPAVAQQRQTIDQYQTKRAVMMGSAEKAKAAKPKRERRSRRERRREPKAAPEKRSPPAATARPAAAVQYPQAIPPATPNPAAIWEIPIGPQTAREARTAAECPEPATYEDLLAHAVWPAMAVPGPSLPPQFPWLVLAFGAGLGICGSSLMASIVLMGRTQKRP